jgi:hypothetical protein
MAELSKDEARRYRASKHAKRREDCPGCGRTVYGNGGKVAHYRRCEAYLALHGWTFNAAEMTTLRRVARESTDHLPDGERLVAWLAFIKAERMTEARRRKLIP